MTRKIKGTTIASSTFGALRQLHTFTRLCVLGSVVRMRWTFALGAHIEAGWRAPCDSQTRVVDVQSRKVENNQDRRENRMGGSGGSNG